MAFGQLVPPPPPSLRRSLGEGELRPAPSKLRRDEVRRGHAKAGLDMCYVYSLKCRNGYYVGCADNLKAKFLVFQTLVLLAMTRPQTSFAPAFLKTLAASSMVAPVV